MVRTIFQNKSTKIESKNNFEEMNNMVDESEQMKIETVINNIRSEKCLNRAQLYEAFFSSGLQEVTDAVGIIIKDPSFHSLYCFS